jgi:hypothetical protein
MNNRRIFLKNLTHMAVASAAAVAAGIPIAAHADLPKLDVNDPQAKALGYVEDSSKADKAKFPKHAATQKCNNCQLYQGKPGDAQGGCPLFAGKSVAGAGWCSAYIKKA